MPTPTSSTTREPAVVPATEKGRRTRDRILEAAAALIHARGVHATSVDDVLAEAGAGKSQFYHYFRNKQDLVRSVLSFQVDRHVTSLPELYARLDTWEGIAAWFDTVVGWMEERGCMGGCPIGSMAAEVADREEDLAPDLVDAFDLFRRHLGDGLRAMQEAGEIRPDADPERLADFVLAAQQGGMLLAKTYKDLTPLRRALDEALAYLKTFATAA